MRATFVRIGVSGAGVLLALGFLAAPAGAGSPHTDQPVAGACTPSERVQGNSSSDPDGMSNGGADKPGCPGGLDADKDGNNGCGNDADREDDNNGNCGRKPARDKTKPTSTSTTSTSTTTTTTTTVDDTLREAGSGTAGVGTAVVSTGDVAASTAGVADNTGTSDPSVQGDSVQGDSVQGDTVTAGEPQTQVLGATLERPGVLARTGAGVGGLALLGGLLCGGGRVAYFARRFLRIG